MVSSYVEISGFPEKIPEWEWKKVTFIMCFFVLLREFRPVEPFFTNYLNSPPLNFTTEQVNEVIYPMGTYSSLVLAILIFLITDYLRYKPIIIMDGVTGILTYLLLFGKPTIPILTVEQMFYGFFQSSDIACNTYLYAKIDDTTLYERITGYVRASSLFGKFTSGLVSQIAVSSKFLRPYDLVYISTAGMTLVTMWSFLIPSVEHSIYFHRVTKVPITPVPIYGNDSVNKASGNNNQFVGNNEQAVKIVVKSEKFSTVMARLWLHFKLAYSNTYVLKWSLWWAFSSCGFNFVNTYSQVLWQVVANEYGGEYYLMNGIIDSIYTVLSALAACFITKFQLNWKKNCDWLLPVVSFVLGLLTVYNYYSRNLWLIYTCYILFGIVYQIIFTIAQSEVAKRIEKDSYALIFGFNNFLSLLLAGILTFTIIEGKVVYFTTKQQFLVFSVYYVIIGLAYSLNSLVNLWRYWRS